MHFLVLVLSSYPITVNPLYNVDFIGRTLIKQGLYLKNAVGAKRPSLSKGCSERQTRQKQILERSSSTFYFLENLIIKKNS